MFIHKRNLQVMGRKKKKKMFIYVYIRIVRICMYTNCTLRSCDLLFIVHSTKLTRFHGNLIGTPMKYNLEFGINCTALDQLKLSNFVECTINQIIRYRVSVLSFAFRFSW